MAISSDEYSRLLKEHEDGLKTNDYSKMIMSGSDKENKIKEFNRLNGCKHNNVNWTQGDQVGICKDCGHVIL